MTAPAMCQCGCGQPAPIAKMTNRRHGHVAGQPVRFAVGHNARCKGGQVGRWQSSTGYIKVAAPGHPRATNGYVLEHLILAERALGRPLPDEAEVHHANENKGDNGRGNLVICQDHAYHFLLHQRARALRACGHADWRKCNYCKKYDDPAFLYVQRDSAHHRACVNKDQKQRKRARHEAEAAD